MSQSTHPSGQQNQAIPDNIKKELALGIKMEDMEKVAEGLSQFWTNNGVSVSYEDGGRVATFETETGGSFTIEDTGIGYGIKAETPSGDTSMRGVDTLNEATVECCEFITTINY